MAEKILVTGATGFIGGRLAEILLESGQDVRLLLRRPDALHVPLRGCEQVIGDLSNKDALGKAVESVTQVFHCAANVSTWDNLNNYLSVNVDGLRNLLDQVVMINPGLQRLVHFSTVDVYDFPRSPCDEESGLKEGRFGYGESKRQSELLLQYYAEKYSLAYTILRPCNVIGPHSQFIERVGAELKNGLMMRVDRGSVNAGLVYVDNLVRYAIWASAAHEAKGQVFNVRDPYDVSWAQFLADLKSGIQGRGLIINSPFWLANSAAAFLGSLYSTLNIQAEPPLHPLIVRIFGRTCGHSAAKLQACCKLDEYIDYTVAMHRSCDWLVSVWEQSTT